MAKEFGFDGMSDYFGGDKMDVTDGLSWKFNDSVTWNETLTALFNNLQLDSSTIFNLAGCGIEKDIKQDDLELYRNVGQCVIIHNCTEEITLKSSLDVNVYFVDPKLNMIDLKIITGDEIFGRGSRWNSK